MKTKKIDTYLEKISSQGKLHNVGTRWQTILHFRIKILSLIDISANFSFLLQSLLKANRAQVFKPGFFVHNANFLGVVH